MTVEHERKSTTSRASSGSEGRYRGCLIGGAVGDALGAPVEFCSLSEITSQFGAGGVRDFVPAYGLLGAITDDTQMALFTAEGLICAVTKAKEGQKPDFQSFVHRAYLRWLKTQRVPAVVQIEDEGWLFGLPALWFQRAPGNTCLSALEEATSIGVPAFNDSKGCGALMRTAPVGLLASPDEAFGVAIELAVLTHSHPNSSLSAAFFAATVAWLVAGHSLRNAIDAGTEMLRLRSGAEEVVSAVERAQMLAASGSASAARVEDLGKGWVAEEALAIALYSVLAARNFEEAVVLAVNHSGDSDSTGSIAGNLAGAAYGIGSIPQRWLENLELRDEIVVLADDLLAARGGIPGLSAERRARYS
jgi:ADP-ribosylglycohydrolase